MSGLRRVLSAAAGPGHYAWGSDRGARGEKRRVDQKQVLSADRNRAKRDPLVQGDHWARRPKGPAGEV